MSGRFRFAVIGTGDIAGFYMGHFARRTDNKNIEFAGAWDKLGDKAAAFSEKFGGKAFNSMEDLLNDDTVDAVVNLTPPMFHFEISRRCLDAGKHVLSEKPLALSVADGRKLIETAKAKGVTLGCSPFILLGHNQQAVKKLLDQGRIGKPISVTAELFHGRVETWHPNPEQFYVEGGGPLLDVGPYPLSLLLTWFGKVTEVQGMFGIAIPDREDLSGRKFKVKKFDNGVALLKFANGVIGRIAFSYANSATGHHGLEIQGDRGSLALSSIMAAGGELKISNRDSGQWDEVTGSPGPYEASGVDWSGGIVELADSVREGREPANSARLALETLEVLLAIEEAAIRVS